MLTHLKKKEKKKKTPQYELCLYRYKSIFFFAYEYGKEGFVAKRILLISWLYIDFWCNLPPQMIYRFWNKELTSYF